MKTASVTAILIIACISSGFAATRPPLKGAQYLSQAKITLAQARVKALKAESGSIVGQELEKEKGSLRYSFDIKIAGTMHEVGIDATTGKVVEDSIDKDKD